MPSLFSLARRPAAAAEKDSDDDSSSGQIAAPLLDGGSAASAPSPLRAASEAFAVRVKLNGSDHVLPGITPRTTVGELRARVLALRDDADGNSPDTRGGQPYLRLIHRGRMMAPDTSRGERYGLADGDVVHAVLAGGDGAGRSGQQARMLRRMNGDDAGGGAGGGTSRLSRGTGIDDRGTVVRRDDDDDSESDFEEADGDIELGPQGGQGNGRRRRERRGFDRLRTVRFCTIQFPSLKSRRSFRLTFIPSRAKNLKT